MIKRNEYTRKWEDTDYHVSCYSKNCCKACVKRKQLRIPYNKFLSNRFVLNNIK